MLSAIMLGVTAMLNVMGKYISKEDHQLLLEHVNKLRDLANLLDTEYDKPLDLQDDKLIPALEEQWTSEFDAYNRQLMVLPGAAVAA